MTGVLLILVPIAFNVAFFALGRAFEYPDILRKEPDEILRRFHAGGPGLILRWEALLLSALAMLPLAGPAGDRACCPAGAHGARHRDRRRGGPRPGARPRALAVRGPGARPTYVAAPDGDAGEATRRAIEVTFATLHRLLGVGIGEHLGYLLTGAWTLLVAASILATTVVPGWLGIAGIPIGVALLVGTLEFVGPNERDGWPLAGTIVPIAYIAWSVWLILLGVLLLV